MAKIVEFPHLGRPVVLGRFAIFLLALTSFACSDGTLQVRSGNRMEVSNLRASTATYTVVAHVLYCNLSMRVVGDGVEGLVRPKDSRFDLQVLFRCPSIRAEGSLRFPEECQAFLFVVSEFGPSGGWPLRGTATMKMAGDSLKVATSLSAENDERAAAPEQQKVQAIQLITDTEFRRNSAAMTAVLHSSVVGVQPAVEEWQKQVDQSAHPRE